MKALYSRREAIVAALFSLAVVGIVWGPVVLRPLNYRDTIDLRTLRLPEDRLATPARLSSLAAKVTKAKPTGQVDVNHADAAALQALPGIGPTLAQRIITHRNTHGPFADPRELLEVDGIGQKRFDKIAPWVEVR